MIIYDTKHWVPTSPNVLTIAGTDNDYYYIHRSLYDQAVVLDYLYKNKISELIYNITGSDETRDDVDYFMSVTPRPLSIFGPFLLLVKDMLTEYSDMVGAIHVMSTTTNLAGMLEIDQRMRNTPQFSLSIKEEYELSWDRFFQSVIPYSPDMYSGGGINPMNGTQTTTADGYEKDASEMTDDEFDEEMFALLNPPEDFLTPPAPAGTEDSTATTADVTPVFTPAPEPAPAPAPIPEPAPAPAPEPEPEKPKRMSGLAAMLGGVV